MEAQWEGWYNERVPALQNKTPLQAARTKAGRERLEALLLEFERRNEEVSQPYLRVDINAMRRSLVYRRLKMKPASRSDRKLHQEKLAEIADVAKRDEKRRFAGELKSSKNVLT